MSDTSKLSTCQTVCWGLAGLTGLMVAVGSTRSTAVIASVLLGLAVAVVLGLLFRWLVCTDYASDDRGIEGRDIIRGLRNMTGITGYKAPPDQASAMDVALGTKPKPAASGAVTAAVKSGTGLPGETELAERKGEWHYDGGDDAGSGQGTADASIGVKPALLSAPRGGQADDLKQIKGVGPKLEQACRDLGIHHFDQIAAWSSDEVAWVDENLVAFKGRVSRDNWVEQAKALAAGEDAS